MEAINNDTNMNDVYKGQYNVCGLAFIQLRPIP
jgi:hypothetical protein